MDTEIVLRQATLADFATLAPPIAALPVFAPYKFEAAGLCKRWSAALADGASITVAELDGSPVGLAWYAKTGTFAAGAYLRFLSVVPGAQGKGAGAALLSDYEQVCRTAPGGLFVLTSQHNSAGAAFYRGHGYCQVGSLPDFAVPGVSEIIFWKR